jgi:hypothetical protein
MRMFRVTFYFEPEDSDMDISLSIATSYARYMVDEEYSSLVTSRGNAIVEGWDTDWFDANLLWAVRIRDSLVVVLDSGRIKATFNIGRPESDMYNADAGDSLPEDKDYYLTACDEAFHMVRKHQLKLIRDMVEDMGNCKGKYVYPLNYTLRVSQAEKMVDDMIVEEIV